MFLLQDFCTLSTKNFEYFKKYSLPKQKFKIECSICGTHELKTAYRIFNYSKLLCKKCKTHESWKNKSPEELQQKQQKERLTKLAKYGDAKFNNSTKQQKTLRTRYGENFYKSLGLKGGKSMQLKFENISDIEKENIKQKREKTCLQKYGKKSINSVEDIKLKKVNSYLKSLEVENPSQSKNIQNKKKMTCLEKYGVENFSQCDEFHKHRKQRYTFNNQNFDSKPELAFYVFCKDHNMTIQRNTKSFAYEFSEKTHRYFPDFEITKNDQKILIEIKGDQFLKKDGTWQNPFDHSQDRLLEAKHQCALKNNVLILYQSDCRKYLDYIYQKYGNDFYEKYKS